MDNHVTDSQQGTSDREEVRRPALPPLLLGRYRRDLTYRQSRKQMEDQRGPRSRAYEALSYVLLAVCIGLAVISAGYVIIYAIDVGTAVRFAASGVTAQATVLKKRSEPSVVPLGGERYIITYGFWVDGSGVISREATSRQTFDALSTDDKVSIRYAAGNPRHSRIVDELTLRFPAQAILWLGLLAISVAGLRAARRRARATEKDTPVANEDGEEMGSQNGESLVEPKRSPTDMA